MLASPNTDNTVPPRLKRKIRRSEDRAIDTSPVIQRLRGATEAGRPAQRWDDIYRKLCDHPLMRRDDGRAACEATIRVRVSRDGNLRSSTWFYVDGDGFLHAVPANRFTSGEEPTVDPTVVEAFLGGRVIGERGENLYWFDPIPRTDRQFARTCEATGTPRYENVSSTSYRQGKALTAEEAETFLGFPNDTREAILTKAPANPTASVH